MKRIIEKLKWEIRKLIFFLLPNINAILKNKIVFNLKKLIIYQPVYLHKNGGTYVIGNNVQFGYNVGGRNKKGYCELQARTNNSKIIIGDNTSINNNLLIISSSLVSIGSYCRIGINCQIMDFNAHKTNPKERSKVGKIANVIVNDNVWIGNNVIILAGCKIGKNSIIGAGAVVTKSIPDNVIAAGVPAKVIKRIEEK